MKSASESPPRSSFDPRGEQKRMRAKGEEEREERVGREVRVKADKCSGCRSWQKVFGENGKTIVWAPPSPPTYAQEPLLESGRKLKYKSKNLWISYTKWRAESELSWAELSLSLSWRIMSVCLGYATIRPCSGQADSGSRPRRIQTKTNNINFKTLRCISN